MLGRVRGCVRGCASLFVNAFESSVVPAQNSLQGHRPLDPLAEREGRASRLSREGKERRCGDGWGCAGGRGQGAGESSLRRGEPVGLGHTPTGASRPLAPVSSPSSDPLGFRGNFVFRIWLSDLEGRAFSHTRTLTVCQGFSESFPTPPELDADTRGHLDKGQGLQGHWQTSAWVSPDSSRFRT